MKRGITRKEKGEVEEKKTTTKVCQVENLETLCTAGFP